MPTENSSPSSLQSTDSSFTPLLFMLRRKPKRNGRIWRTRHAARATIISARSWNRARSRASRLHTRPTTRRKPCLRISCAERGSPASAEFIRSLVPSFGPCCIFAGASCERIFAPRNRNGARTPRTATPREHARAFAENFFPCLRNNFNRLSLNIWRRWLTLPAKTKHSWKQWRQDERRNWFRSAAKAYELQRQTYLNHRVGWKRPRH